MSQGKTAPPLAEQKKLIAKAGKSAEPLKKGQKWYPIVISWWREFEDLAEGDDGSSLGPLDNSSIYDEKLRGLKPNMNQTSDFVLQGEQVWKLLSKWYPIKNEIPLDVVEKDDGDLVIDLYPAKFQVTFVEDDDGETEASTTSDAYLVMSRYAKMADILVSLRTFLKLKDDTDLSISLRGKEDQDWKKINFKDKDEQAKIVGDTLPEVGIMIWQVKARKLEPAPEIKKPVIVPYNREKPEIDQQCDAKLYPRKRKKKKAKPVKAQPIKARGKPRTQNPFEKEDKKEKATKETTKGAKEDEEKKEIAEESKKEKGTEVVAKKEKETEVTGEESANEKGTKKKGDDAEEQASDENNESDDDSNNYSDSESESEEEVARWLEAKVVKVDTVQKTVTIHFLSFEPERDAVFKWDSEEIKPPYSQVPDWRTQLRREEDVDLKVKNTWHTAKVVRIDRTGKVLSAIKRPSVSVGKKMIQQVGNFFSGFGVGSKNTMEKEKRESSDESENEKKPAERKPSVPVSAYGLVKLQFRERFSTKEAVVDLGSELVAAAYTHTAKPKERYFNFRSRVEAPEFEGVVGLQNIGNTCFMNSTLQCLNSTEPLTEYFLSGDYKGDLNRRNPLGTGGKLAEAYAKLLKEIHSNKVSVVRPDELKRVVGNAFPAFKGYNQHDAHEFLSQFVDGLHEDLNKILEKPPTPPVESDGLTNEEIAEKTWDFFLMRNQSVVVDTMYGLMRSHLVCPDCKNEAIKFDAYNSWSVPIPVVTRLLVSIVFVPLPKDGTRQVYHFAMERKSEKFKGRNVADFLFKKTGVEAKNVVIYSGVDRLGSVKYYPSVLQEKSESLHVREKLEQLIAFELDPLDEAIIQEAREKEDERQRQIAEKKKKLEEEKAKKEAEEVAKAKEEEEKKNEEDGDGEDEGKKDKEGKDKLLGGSKQSEEKVKPGKKEMAKKSSEGSVEESKIEVEVATKSKSKRALAKEAKEMAKLQKAKKEAERKRKKKEKKKGKQMKSARKQKKGNRGAVGPKVEDEEEDVEKSKEGKSQKKTPVKQTPVKKTPRTFVNDYPLRETERSTGVWLMQLAFYLEKGSAYKSLRMPDVLRVVEGATNADVHAQIWKHLKHMFDLKTNPYEKEEVTKEEKDVDDDEEEEEEEEDGDESEEDELDAKADKKETTATKEENNVSKEEKTEAKKGGEEKVVKGASPKALRNGGKDKKEDNAKFGKDVTQKVLEKTTKEEKKPIASRIGRRKKRTGPPPEEVQPSDLYKVSRKNLRHVKQAIVNDDSEFKRGLESSGNKIEIHITPVGTDYMKEIFSKKPVQTSYLRKTFGEYHKSLNMGPVNAEDESFSILAPRKEDKITLAKCCKQFQLPEVLGAMDEWYCNKCQNHVRATKKMDIWTTGNILCLHLKRFKGHGWRGEKLTELVEFPMEFDISEYVLSEQKENQYELYGVAHHMGGVGGGHYVAHVKNENGWFHMNDSSTRKTKGNNIVSPSAYVLFYQRVKKDGAEIAEVKGTEEVEIVPKTQNGEI